MAETDDPLRFLNLNRRRKPNKANPISDKVINSRTSHFVLPSFTSLTSIENPQPKQYDPLKYFSQSIEDFLNASAQSQQKQMTFAKDKVPLETLTFSRENQKRLFEQTPQKNHAPTPEEEKQRLVKGQEGQEEPLDGGDPGVELHECEVCGRKFNLKSYEKHVRVCERVFKQKRKPFRSRSTSLEAPRK